MKRELTYKPLADLIPYANNSRTHSDEQVNQVAASIKEFGFTNPILVDEQGGIIAGHGRLMAAKKLRLDEVPTITLAGLTEAQKKAYVIADNQLALNAGWNEEALKLELESLSELNFDLDLIGFDQSELDRLLDIVNEAEGDNAYTKKVDIPVYEPSGEKPSLDDLYEADRSYDLIHDIKESNLPEDEKQFLMLAAGRHVVFDFEQIANYYAHSSEECQRFMEDSALVIIDFNKAIELGYVNLSEKISEQYTKDYPDEE